MGHFHALRILAAGAVFLMLLPIAVRGQETGDSRVNETSSPRAANTMQSPPQRAPQLQPVAERRRNARIKRYLKQLKHPLTPRDQEMRAAVRKLGTSHWRFVHVELQGDKIVTGNVVGIADDGFSLETGLLGSGRFVAYREVVTAPREVAAVGTRTLRGLEWTGFVTACVAAIPLAVVFYPLVLAGVIQD